MKGFTRDHKFIPMTDYKKVTRKSRDQKAKTQGVRMKRLTQLQVDEIKKNVLPLDKHAIMMMEFHQGQARRDRIANPIWNSMTQAERLKALERSGVHETAMGQKLPSRETLSKLPYHQLPHYAKTDLGFHFFNLDREGRERKKRDEQVITIDGHSTILPADPNSSKDEDRHAEQTVRIGLVKRRQALALIKKSSPKGISDWEIREILGSEALPEIRVLSQIDKTVVEKDGIYKVAKK